MYTRYHPVFLDLNGRAVLVVGGGAVAIEKLESLMPAGASITVVAPDVDSRIESWHREGRLVLERKPFEEGDVAQAFMVIAATDDPVLNAYIYDCGNRRLRLTNSVDDPAHCNFIMAAIASDGPVQVAVSSAGCSPAIAQRVRARIAAEILGEGVGDLAEFLGDWRPAVKAALPTYKARKGFWERVIDSEIAAVLASNGRSQADMLMQVAISWAVAHVHCLGCDCRAKGFQCPLETAA